MGEGDRVYTSVTLHYSQVRRIQLHHHFGERREILLGEYITVYTAAATD